MQDTLTPDRATEYQRRRSEPRRSQRPDRFALWAVVMAVVAMFAGLVTSDAGAASGGISATSGGAQADGTKKAGSRYDRIWRRTSTRNRRWARRTGRCESGNDPRAIGGGGKYRGAFQFLRSTWRNSPKSPGGDPIRYRWRVQAVVAVKLKQRDGRNHWPNCG